MAAAKAPDVSLNELDTPKGDPQGASQLVTSSELSSSAVSFGQEIAVERVSQAKILLRKVDLKLGWRESEWRWQVDLFSSPRRTLTQPQWRGEPLHGDRRLLHSEQGLGDTIQFMRYLPMVQRSGGNVVLEVPPTLRRIVEEFPWIGKAVSYGEPLPDFELRCPLMSLPLAYNADLAIIPTCMPYLFVPQSPKAKALALPWPIERLHVGVVWAGSPRHNRDALRSLRFRASSRFSKDVLRFSSCSGHQWRFVGP